MERAQFIRSKDSGRLELVALLDHPVHLTEPPRGTFAAARLARTPRGGRGRLRQGEGELRFVDAAIRILHTPILAAGVGQLLSWVQV